MIFFLVLNQDYLLLLTNLCIGEGESLRLHELLIEFQNAVYF
ncbi:DNA phosphorothioation-dependent restriction protein DptG (plasmid) [Pseudoalteromonas espejiana]